MTEPSDQAKRKARMILTPDAIYPVLINAQGFTEFVNGCVERTARVLQEHSDKAKEADRGFDKCGYEDAPGSLRHKIKSLILDDEPCKHTVSYIWIGGGLVSDYCGIRCSKCGKRLKIVEAGDD